MKWTQEELEQLYQQVNAKAAADEAFRKELAANPKEVLEKAAGRPLPDDFNLKIIESDSNASATYMAPDFVQGELDSEKLEQVTGGGNDCGSKSKCNGYSCLTYEICPVYAGIL